MSILDLPCKNSVSFSKDCCNMKVCHQILLLGGFYRYLSFLNFDLPPYSYMKDLKCAKLILFKQPLMQCKTFASHCGCHTDCSHDNTVSPLLEFFSTYSRQYQIPKADYSKQIKFEDDENLCYTEIDITTLVHEWKSDSIENRGIMLIGNDYNKPICYASEKNDNKTMCPIIRLIYKENSSCLGLASTPCVVDIKSF